MIGFSSSLNGSVAATVPAAAIAAITGIDATGVATSVVLTRPALRLALRPAGNAEQAGNRGTHQEDPNHPDENLAQILASSAVYTLKGNQR
ncbi:hypothetical protein JVX98_07045 (plasmid) [Ensifer sp. PDNC004]|uniref:hypothetical protein n=1 Tax=Ensifer sp. PDNC004 TaxID=2811423 RepID=UPI0019625654|nr:hypothetical protein [Ensifer sp. PDNC004]QRY65389.1 hypothetical protein JVX98_07045 [Ensifer sp. PDNC004]